MHLRLPIALVVCLLSVSVFAQEKPDLDALSKKLLSRQVAERIAACKSIGELGANGKGASRALCLAATDTNRNAALAAVDALEKVNPKIAKVMIAMVSGGEFAVDPLEAIGEEPAPVAPVLVLRMRKGLNDQRNYAALEQAAKLLANVAPLDPATFPLFLEAVTYPQFLPNGFRSACIDGLKKIDKADQKLRPRVISAVMKTVFQPNSPRTNDTELIALLGYFGPDSKAALPALRNLKLDQSEVVRNAANEAIRKIEAP